MAENRYEYDRQNLVITVRFGDKRELRITTEQAIISYFSGGPGGQNVNKNMNGVRLIYTIPDGYLNSFQKTRQLVTRSISQRSREQNLRQTFDQLAEKIKRYFYVPPKRTRTRIPKGSKENRLQGKKMRGKLKQDRKRVDY
jgi:ribosome-associated protein